MSKESTLEQLVYLGRATETVEVLGLTIVFRTLTGSEKTDMLDASSSYRDFARINSMRNETLYRSIVSLNGIPLLEIFEAQLEKGTYNEDKNLLDRVATMNDAAKRKYVISILDDTVLNAFYDAFNKFDDKRSAELNEKEKEKEDAKDDDLKNSPSDQQGD